MRMRSCTIWSMKPQQAFCLLDICKKEVRVLEFMLSFLEGKEEDLEVQESSGLGEKVREGTRGSIGLGVAKGQPGGRTVKSRASTF